MKKVIWENKNIKSIYMYETGYVTFNDDTVATISKKNTPIETFVNDTLVAITRMGIAWCEGSTVRCVVEDNQMHFEIRH